MSDINDDDEAYLIVSKDSIRHVISPETAWAKIDEDGKLELIRWDLIETFANEYDSSSSNRSQNQVMGKLLTLVRDHTRRQYERL